MPTRVLLGMLTPSSNTVLEPVTTAMLAGLPETSAHFGRFKVTEIALTREALGQFDDSEILGAAELLSHANVGVIGWSGTSASWRGFDTDEALCRRITEATGIPACTSVLALNELFARLGVRRFGLVTPYLDDVQGRIIANYAAAGLECVAERHLGLRDNFSFSEVDADTLRTMVREVAAGERSVQVERDEVLAERAPRTVEEQAQNRVGLSRARANSRSPRPSSPCAARARGRRCGSS